MFARSTSVPAVAKRHRQSGYTLMEILVSALILSIGLVGVAGVQALALVNNQSAYVRSQATTMAYDLADRMRTNVEGANAGFYNPGAAATHASCKTAVGCSTQQLAENDLAEWNAALTANLPMGTGFVCIDSTPDDGTGVGAPACDGNGTQFSIKIWWDGDRDGAISVAADNLERMVINFQL
ncbi:MAG: type IV pilus modification protein PilV [Pseudomonadota bacterium]